MGTTFEQANAVGTELTLMWWDHIAAPDGTARCRQCFKAWCSAAHDYGRDGGCKLGRAMYHLSLTALDEALTAEA